MTDWHKVEASLDTDLTVKYCPKCGANGADLQVGVGVEVDALKSECASCSKCGLEFSVSFKVEVNF